MANIYDQASLVMIPSGTKTSKIFSQKPVNGDGDFTFSRSTAATRVNASGNIEKETQNLLLQSNSFNTTWSGFNGASGQTGYDGSSDAWRYDSSSSVLRLQQTGITFSGVHTFSFYAKYVDAQWFALQIAGTTDESAWFDIQNGTLGSTSSAVDSSITSIGGGWHRCSVTGSASNQNRVRLYVVGSDGSLSNITASLLIQDAQLEQGLVARDVIETTTAAVEGGITDNVPRLDYTDSSCPALLLEPLRTNYYTQSEYVQTGTRVTLANNATTSPEGVDNAASVIATSVSGSHEVLTGQITISGAGVITFSTFAKYNGNHLVLTKAYNSSNWTGCVFDLQNGVAKTPQNNGVSDVCTADVEDYGNGWYRCSITFTPFASANQYIISLTDNVNATLGTWGADTYMGDDVSGIYLYGSQAEAGSYATSYIPTYGTSVTRNGETCLGAGDANTFNSTEGVLYWEGSFDSTSTIAGAIALIGGGSNRVQLYNSGTSLVALIQVNGSAIWSQSTSGTIDITSNHKYAVKWALNDFALWIDGVEFAVNSSGATFSDSALTELRFSDFGAGYLYAKTNQVLTFNTALSDTELADLTTI